MNEILDYDNIWCSCPECNGVVRIGSKHERASGGTYDAVCPGCRHGFQYKYEDNIEELIDKTVANFKEIKRRKSIDKLITQLKLAGYIE